MAITIKCFADEDIVQEGANYNQASPSEQGQEQGNCEGTIIKRIAPDKFLVLKLGKIKYSQDGKVGEFDLTEDDIKNLIEEFNQRGKDIVMDYEHGTLNNEAGFQGKAPASAWIDGLEMTPDGLVAKVKRWTDNARKLVENGEYRYPSPVVIFDDKTGRPIGLQSIALTNHPAIHNIPALVAANDTGINTMENGSDVENKQSVVQKFKNLLVEIKGGMESIGDLFDSTMQDVQNFVKGDDNLEKEIKAFNDSTFAGFTVKAFADDFLEQTPGTANPNDKRDLMSVIFMKRDQLNGPQLLEWVDGELNITQLPEEKRVLESERKRLVDLKSTHPDLWEKGFTSVNPATTDYILKNEQEKQNMMPMSDIKTFSGIDVDSKEGIANELKSLSDKTRTATMYLKMNDVSSFEELDNKIKKEREVINKELDNAKNVIKMNDINKVVDKAMADGKLTEASKASAIELAKVNMKAFNDFMATQSKIVASYKDLVEDEAVPFSDKTAKHEYVSNVQQAALKAFGECVTSDVDFGMTFK